MTQGEINLSLVVRKHKQRVIVEDIIPKKEIQKNDVMFLLVQPEKQQRHNAVVFIYNDLRSKAF